MNDFYMSEKSLSHLSSDITSGSDLTNPVEVPSIPIKYYAV